MDTIITYLSNTIFFNVPMRSLSILISLCSNAMLRDTSCFMDLSFSSILVKYLSLISFCFSFSLCTKYLTVCTSFSICLYMYLRYFNKYYYFDFWICSLMLFWILDLTCICLSIFAFSSSISTFIFATDFSIIRRFLTIIAG